MILKHFRTLFSLSLWYMLFAVLVAFIVFFFPRGGSLAVQIIQWTLDFFSASGFSFIVMSPADGFVMQVYVALWVGMLLALPYLLHALYGFVAPALYVPERRGLLLAGVMSVILFVLGAIFGFFVVVPPSLKVLLEYNTISKIQALYPFRDFMEEVITLCLYSGLSFVVPVLMVLLSKAKLVPPEFWFQMWRYVVLLVLSVSAIITPDGTGVAMALLSAPIIALYFLGSFVAVLTRSRT